MSHAEEVSLNFQIGKPKLSRTSRPPLISVISDTSKSERNEDKMSVDPETAKFARNGAGKSDHMIVNYTQQRMALKVKCSNNNEYRVDPVMQFIEANKCRNIQITRLPTATSSKKDKIIILYADCDEKTTDLPSFFKVVDKLNNDLE